MTRTSGYQFHAARSRSAARLACMLATLGLQTALFAKPVEWVSSTPDAPWTQQPAPEFSPAPADHAPEIRVVPRKTFQTIDGFGGCFNELGWAALGKLPPAEQQKAMHALFDADGLAFNLGRIPIGASDYATDAYSLDDTAGDYELKHFSIDRDRKLLLPFIKAAIAIQPGLKCWASPWSPPAWMKTNNNYSRGRIQNDAQILKTYANYFSKWLDAYRDEGVNIYAITPQNEPNITNIYPTCEWTGEQLRDFIGNYLGPALKQRQPSVELWLGLNGDPPSAGNNANARLAAVMEDAKASSYLAGIAFQYDSANQIAAANQLYPDKKLMQSETDCKNGANSWADAQDLYVRMRRYFEGGARAYFAWNMVLAPGGASTWGWKQNALITADEKSQTISLNGEYYVMQHFSRFIKPGAKRLMTTGWWGDQIAFANPDGSIVLVVGNSQAKAMDVRIGVAGMNDDQSLAVSVPGRSISTFVFN